MMLVTINTPRTFAVSQMSSIIKNAFVVSPEYEALLAKWPRDLADAERSKILRARVVFVLLALALLYVTTRAVDGLALLVGTPAATLAVCAVVGYVCRAVAAHEDALASLAKLPQAPHLPLLGHLYVSPLDPASLMVQLERMAVSANPGAFVLRVFTQPFVYVTHPDAVRAIVSGDFMDLPKNKPTRIFAESWLGKGILIGSGHSWKMQRKLVTPAFHIGALRKYFDVYKKHAATMVQVARKAASTPAPFDIVTVLGNCTLDIIAETACGYQTNAQQQGADSDKPNAYSLAVQTACRLVCDHVFTHPETPPFLWHRFMDTGRAYVKAVNYCHETCARIIQTRVNEQAAAADEVVEGKNTDFLGMLLTAEDEEHNKLTHEMINDNVNTFIFAGHDTSKVATAWLLFEVAMRPQVEAKIVAELMEVLKGRPVDELEYDDLKQLKYLECTIKEALRFHSAVPLYGRYLEKELDCGIYRLPAHTEVFILPQIIHNLPEFWDNPDVFDPERFTPERSVGRHPFAFVPFSAGARNCIGQAFALNVQKTLVANLLYHFHFDVTQVIKATHLPAVVMQPKDGIRLVGRERLPSEREVIAITMALPNPATIL